MDSRESEFRLNRREKRAEIDNDAAPAARTLTFPWKQSAVRAIKEKSIFQVCTGPPARLGTDLRRPRHLPGEARAEAAERGRRLAWRYERLHERPVTNRPSRRRESSLSAGIRRVVYFRSRDTTGGGADTFERAL